MLTFFRKVRKSLIDSSSARKYLLYAIGEILLVMIGILLALQVNNWNTERIEKKELNEYLLTIAQNIRGDLPEVQDLKNQRDSIRACSENSYRLIRKKYYDIEDAFYLAKCIIGSFEVKQFNSNKSGFESLKNSGLIGNIQGTELAEAIFEYYRKVDIINNLVQHANTYSQGMQMELMKQEFAPEWGRINGTLVRSFRDGTKIDEELWDKEQMWLEKTFRHPSVFGMFARNTSARDLQDQYQQISDLGSRIIRDIENEVTLN